MSAAAFRWAMEQGRRHVLPALERLLLIVLADRSNGSDGYCGQASLMIDTGLAERAIRQLLGSLVWRGLIRAERRGRVMHYHIVRANGMDADPKRRHQMPVSEPETPAPDAGITPARHAGVHAPVIGIPAPESGVEGQYRTPVPVFDAPIAPPTRARVDSPFLEKKEEDSESPVEGKGEEVQEEREGGVENPPPKPPKRAHQLPDSWSPNEYSFSLGTELGLNHAEILAEADHMRDWALDKRQTGFEWDRRFNNWLRKEGKARRLHAIRNRPKQTLAEEWGLKSFLLDDDELPFSERLQ